MYSPDAVFIGLPHSGSTFLRSYFSYHDEISWERNAIHFMKSEFDPQSYLSLVAPQSAKVFIDVYELLAINFLIPANVQAFVSNRFALNFDLSGQELADYSLIPSRIKATLPNARIIMILRNQITWLQSHYLYHIQNLPVRHRKFSDYANCLDGKRISRAGLYHLTIGAYQEVFGAKNIHVLCLEQVMNEADQTLAALCSFLGVSYIDFPKDKRETHPGRPAAAGRVIQLLSKIGISIRGASRLSWLYGQLGNLSSNMKKSTAITDNEIALLNSFYSHSNAQTSRLINIDLKAYGYPV